MKLAFLWAKAKSRYAEMHPSRREHHCSLILLTNRIQEGSIKVKLKANFDKKKINYPSYLASGEITDAQLNLFNNKKIFKI